METVIYQMGKQVFLMTLVFSEFLPKRTKQKGSAEALSSAEGKCLA
jgi:hypothetical protein